MHTTNYLNTFVEAAADCPAETGRRPEKPDTIAGHQYALLLEQRYFWTSDDLLYEVHRRRAAPDASKSRDDFFAKPQACLRASPLGKQFGWGLHHDSEGKIALYGLGTPEYERFMQDDAVKKVSAMRNKRA